MLRKAREERERKAREDAEFKARSWSFRKVRALEDLIGKLDSKRQMDTDLQNSRRWLKKKLSRFRQSNERHTLGKPSTSYKPMAEAAEACLAQYNRFVPKEKQKTVRDL